MGLERKEHVLLFPFMAHGHLIPFLALALHLERTKNYQITLINTPLNITKLQSSLPPSSGIRFRSLPFDGARHGLPPGAENTDGLPYDLIFRLMQASFALEPDLRAILADIVQEHKGHGEFSHNPPICIITDMFFAWAGRVAHQFNMFHAIFAATSGLGLACYYSLWSSVPRWRQSCDSNTFEMLDFPEGGKVHVTQMPASMAAADGFDPWSIFQKRMLSEWFNADAALFNTVEELDRVGLDYFRIKLRIPVYAIGPVLSPDRKTDKYKAWLDSKPPRSVLYICFGTQNTLSSSQMAEMAKGLEASGRFFIWVVRLPPPAGFEDRVKGRGLVVRNWAPQMEILSHRSTGGFVSHCGWNSVVEALSYGVPMMGWPMAGEQFFNVKLVEGEMGVCVEVGRGNGCEVKGEEIARKIEMVMGESEAAMEMRRRAWKVKKVIEDAKGGASVGALDELFRMMMARRGEELGV